METKRQRCWACDEVILGRVVTHEGKPQCEECVQVDREMAEADAEDRGGLWGETDAQRDHAEHVASMRGWA